MDTLAALELFTCLFALVLFSLFFTFSLMSEVRTLPEAGAFPLVIKKSLHAEAGARRATITAHRRNLQLLCWGKNWVSN
jgi:hypothetical protein